LTLIVVILSKDGVVVASDRQATEDVTGQPIRAVCEKIYPLGKGVLWGASGDGGAIQEVKEQLDAIPPNELGQHGSLCARFTKAIFDVNKPRVARFKALGLEKNPPILGKALLAQFDRGRPRIVEFNYDGSPTDYGDLGYQAIGSGDIFARATLLGQDTHDLTLDQARTLGYMTVQRAIEIAAYGLGYPIDIWTLSMKKDSPTVERMGEEEKKGLNDAVAVIFHAQREVFLSHSSH
jgi:20S proteasome alpha/beta subunit